VSQVVEGNFAKRSRFFGKSCPSTSLLGLPEGNSPVTARQTCIHKNPKENVLKGCNQIFPPKFCVTGFAELSFHFLGKQFSNFRKTIGQQPLTNMLTGCFYL